MFQSTTTNRIFMVVSLIIALNVASCGSSNNTGSTGSGNVSTDAAANQALLTNFANQAASLSGNWTNDSTGDSGTFAIVPTFDETTKILALIPDFTGPVIGALRLVNPETLEIDMTDFINNGTSEVQVESANFGSISAILTYNDDGTGTYTGTSTNVPAGVTNVTMTGGFSMDGSKVLFGKGSLSYDFVGDNRSVSADFDSVGGSGGGNEGGGGGSSGSCATVTAEPGTQNVCEPCSTASQCLDFDIGAECRVRTGNDCRCSFVDPSAECND